MEIKAGKYTLLSDQWSMWIEEEYSYEGKKGRNKGKLVIEKRRVAGYSPDFKSLLNSFEKRKMRNSDAKSMKEILVTISEAEKDMIFLVKKAYEENFGLEGK